VLLLAVTSVAALLARRPSLDPIEPPARNAFAAPQVHRGATLAAVGNCQGCHTTAEGPAWAGGVPVPTPFGTIYGSNITPDAETGIGRWSLEAFRRAMREGVGRGGEHLYPAFPYDHFTRLTDADIESLYAYVMTRDPVRAVPPANRLAFPLQFRPLLAAWKLLYFRKGDASDRASASTTAAARGDYLIDALAHCGACHSPRNALGAEARDPALAYNGGQAEGWYAPALNARSPSPVPWTVDQLEQYLRSGIAEEHAIAGGPMQPVTHELAWAAPADVRAIAESVAAMMGEPTGEKLARANAARQRAAAGPQAWAAPSASVPAGSSSKASAGAPNGDPTLLAGASVYLGACADCHDAGRGLSSNSALQLPLAVALYDPDPRSLVRIVRLGILPPDGESRRFMPAFEGALDDGQITALLAFLRRRAAAAPPWPDLAKAVHEAHAQTPADVRISQGR
jgi:mono/diheme cytochrome c family protein